MYKQTDELIYNNFLKNFETKDKGNVGVELEFPLINKDPKAVDVSVCHGLLQHFLDDGFTVEELDLEGNPAFIIDENKDVLSFDNSYNNFEFAMNYGDNLCVIADRFYRLFYKAQEFLKLHRHKLIGRGTNPKMWDFKPLPVPYGVYGMIGEFLRENQDETTHKYSNFPEMLSSTQTHLDVNIKDLPKALTLFGKLDFARGYIFANSPDFSGEGYRCYRDFLWQKSGFSKTGNVGSIEGKYYNTQEIVDDIKERTMFYTAENNVYKHFKPLKIADYFNENNLSDINYYLSFKNVEVTRRGTLEIRSDCTQDADSAFSPVAFNLGILYNMDKAAYLTDKFLADNNVLLSNGKMREMACCGEFFTAKNDLIEYLIKLTFLSAEGLKSRGRGEEAYLIPLLDNKELLTRKKLRAKLLKQK